MEIGDSGPRAGAGSPDEGPDAQASAVFRRLFELHFGELYGFAYRYVRTEEAARDLAREGFLRLWRQRTQVDLGGVGVRSYLYTVVRYRALDQLRRRRPEPTAREIATAMRQAVETLQRRQQEVSLLRRQRRASPAIRRLRELLARLRQSRPPL